MNGLRLGWTARLTAGILALGVAILPVGAAGGTSSGTVLTAAPVGSTTSTVYMSVTNVSLEPRIANMNLALTSESTTLVGFTSVSVAPLSTTVVPVRMSGTLTLTMQLNLSGLLVVGIAENADPF